MSRDGVSSEAPAPEPPLTDWTLRPFARRRSPLLVGAGYALGMILLSWGVRLLLVEWDQEFVDGPYFWLDMLNGVLFGYVATANWLLRRGRLRDLAALRPLLRCDEAEWQRIVRRAVCVPKGRLALAALAGAVVLGALPAVDPRFWDGPAPALTDPLMLFFMARMAMMGVLCGHAVVTEYAGAVVFEEIGATSLEVDLFDPYGLAPFARAGLRSAFVWVLASSLVSLFWLGPAAGSTNTAIVFGLLTSVSLGFYWTLRGVHRSVRRAKQRTLDGLREQIRGVGATLQGGAASPASPALADLVALHGWIERVPDWPISTPTLVRVALVAALGIGSWLGGALVERLIDRFL